VPRVAKKSDAGESPASPQSVQVASVGCLEEFPTAFAGPREGVPVRSNREDRGVFVDYVLTSGTRNIGQRELVSVRPNKQLLTNTLLPID
jgi:hypothetical protein